jgi:DHA2 family multidrug resistance protein
MSDSLEEIVIARVAQGVFGAPLPPLSQTLVLAVFPKKQISVAMAIWGMGTILGPVIAPTIGGYLGELLNWRWIFYTLVPFGLCALLAVMATVPKRPTDGGLKLDWIGFLALASSVAALQIMFDRGERNSWFESTETIIECGIAIFGFYIFIAHSLTTNKPFINLNIFKDRNYTVGLILIFFFGMLNFVPMVIFPPLLQELRGYPQSVIGLILGVRGIGTFIGFAIIAFTGRVDPRIIIFFGFGIQAVSGFYMSTFDINMTFSNIVWASLVQGLGVGLTWPPVSVICFATLSNKFHGEATAMFHLIRNIGSSFFISVSVAVVLHMGQINFEEIGSTVSLWNQGINFSGVINSLDDLNITKLTNELNRQSLMVGYIDAFKLYSWVGFLSIPLIFLIKITKTQNN